MIITTTNSVDGFRIVKYFHPVAVNLVTGTGFLDDIAARFSDFFGGRSETYQSHLGEIYTAALGGLEEKAVTAGANGLVGARFDLGEISGKSMQMFMINAVATPVTLRTDLEIEEDARAQDQVQRETERQAEARRQRFASVNSVDGLLNDPEIASRARELLRMYGRNACVSFLKRQAQELGLEQLELSPSDLPDSF